MQKFLAGFVVCLVLIPFGVGAQQPSWVDTVNQESTAQILQSFTTVYTVGPLQALTVPTVVEVPIATFDAGNQNFAVVEEGATSERFVAHRYVTTQTVEPTPVRVFSDQGEPLPALTDDRAASAVQFDLQNDQMTETRLTIEADTIVRSSAIILTLAPNVARPTTVRLTATSDTGRQTVIAQRQLTSTDIQFPATSASTFELTLTHTQPLRITELRLQQDDMEASVTRGVRFLAQPGLQYRVYADPEVPVRVPTPEAGNLQSQEGVQVLETVARTSNPMFQPSDLDGDMIPDSLDNCVGVENQDQTDVDANGRGDVCDDFDRDRVINSLDNCVNEPNTRQADEDGDGIGDACDTTESRLTEQYTWIPWIGLGAAALVLLGMFVYMLRQPRPDVLGDSNPEDSTS